MAGKYLRFMKAQLSNNVRVMLEYKGAFLGYVLSIIFSRASFLLLWYFVFDKFGQLNGWYYSDMLVQIAMICFAEGFAGVLFGGRGGFPSLIESGGLDQYLVLPMNEVVQVLTSKMSSNASGHLATGIILAIAVIPPSRWPWVLLFGFCGMLIIVATSILASSVTFWLSRDFGLERVAFMMGVAFGGYPTSVYSGATRLFLSSLFPVLFIAGIPAQVIKTLDPAWVLLIIGVSVAYLSFAMVVFYRGLRRYESGSMITIRA